MRDLGLTMMKTSLAAFMSTRCNVSSQHKLPGIEELMDLTGIKHLKQFYQVMDLDILIHVEDMVAEGKWFRYGPYLSDHPIDVM